MASDQALRDLIMASNPVGYYPLDTLANLGRDVSTLANNGTQSGTFKAQTLTLAGMDIVTAKGVSAALVSIPDKAQYRGGTFTLECIISHTDASNLVIAERGPNNNNWSLQSVGSTEGWPVPSCQFLLGTVYNVAYAVASLPLVGHLIFTSTGGVTKVYLNGEPLMITDGVSGSGGQTNQTSVPIHLFSRNKTKMTSAALAHVAFYNRELTTAELAARSAMFNLPFNFKLQPLTAVPANQEPRSQFQPQDVAWRGSPGFVVAGPVPNLDLLPTLMVNTHVDRYWLRGLDEFHLKQGFIAGQATLQGVPQRGKKVFCFDDTFQVVGECITDGDGAFRFDLLWLHKTYTVMAFDSNSNKYAPVAADRRMPEAYA